MSFLDYPDNKSHSIIIYIMGCEHACSNCQNVQFQNIDYEFCNNVNVKDILELIKHFSNKFRTNKVVLSGGDPLYKKNIAEVKEILLDRNYNFMVYTGYNIDYVIKNNVSGFKFIKCGKYQENLKQKSEKTDDFLILASKNQKIYNENFKLVSNEGILEFKQKGEI
jgi:organic radical activating enzyme